jgi:hypothetical protein
MLLFTESPRGGLLGNSRLPMYEALGKVLLGRILRLLAEAKINLKVDSVP